MAGRRAGGKGQHGAVAKGQKDGTAAPLLECLAGLRAVSSIGIVVLHSFMFWQFFLSHQTKYYLTQSNPLVKVASAGMVWVDVLLVMSAALAAFQLLPLLEDRQRTAPSTSQVVLDYWRRRARRILPAYAAANLAVVVALGPVEVPQEVAAARWVHFYHCPRTLWANLLFVQNFLGTQACAIHLWSIATQVQFYTAFPLLLWALRPHTPGFRTRLAAALGVVALGGTAWRLWAAWRADILEVPVGDFAVDRRSQLSWAHMLACSYLPLPARVTELAAGAGLGLLLRSPAALKQLHRRRVWLSAAALALQATYLRLLLARHLLFRPPGALPWPANDARLHVALLSYGSPFLAAAVCASLLALALGADPLHTAVARLLAAQAWRPLADLSYASYLTHEQARLWAVLLLPAGWLPRFIVEQPLPSLAAVCAGTLAAGYATALPLYYLVEKPWLGASS